MEKRYNPYIKQAIETSEESKKTITISKDLIDSVTDDKVLGMLIRRMLVDKIKQCDEHIEHMKSLKENFLPTDLPDELR
jgi:hypothetical protein